MLRKDKLFEIKVHGLPKRKKRELEATLRDFASSLQSTPDTSRGGKESSSSSRHSHRNRIHSGSRSLSKNAPSSSGSNNRPVDSAYASMSVGAHSSGTSMGRPSMGPNSRSSEQKVESYLRDIPEALYPRHMSMTDKEKRKHVVKRLEHLFTGKLNVRKDRLANAASGSAPRAHTPNTNMNIYNATPAGASLHAGPVFIEPPPPGANEPVREARILPTQPDSGSGKKNRSRDNTSSRSAEDQASNGNSSGGANPSPTMPPPPEQRATRLKDLDPDRVQVPAENIEYIKHLGLVPPELLAEPAADVHPDADGWVYLNLLCNLAQLHMINVTTDFVRAAVSEMSTKFQLSPDGRKIRWRGGTDGTKFNSDNSSEASHHSMEIDTDGSGNKEGWRKRQKTGHSTGDEFQSGSSGRNPSKLGQHSMTTSESFHYKPLFVHQDSANGHSSMDETLSSFGPVEESNVDDSRWGSATSTKRKRRYDGAIIYYNGAPFCTDLSGDPNEVSPSSANNRSPPGQFARPMAIRSDSGSFVGYRPLSDGKLNFSDSIIAVGVESDDTPPGLTADTGDESSEVDLNLEWSDEQQFLKVHTLEPCGLGGVLPEDHFMVVVTTKRAKDDEGRGRVHRARSKDANAEITDSIVSRLASMSTSSQGPVASLSSGIRMPVVEIEYVSGRIKRLTPVRLPPPAMFFPPFSSDSSIDYDEYSEDPMDESEPDGVARPTTHFVHSDDYPDGVDLTSGDEDGEDPEDETDMKMYAAEDGTQSKRMPVMRRQSSAEAAAGTSARGRSKSNSAEMTTHVTGSSAATAGGHESNLDSSEEEMSS